VYSENGCECSVNTVAVLTGTSLPWYAAQTSEAGPVGPAFASRPRPMGAQLATLRVAVIDDDSGFLRVLAKRLEGSGYQHRILSGPVPAEELAAMKLNALVVDPALLGPLAMEFLERVCGMLPGVGVIVCTQGATLAQRVRGLRLGADDWISKPCHPEEVMARIEAVVRRHRRGQTREDVGPLVAGELEIMPDRFQAYIGGESLEFTRREFELLGVLAEHGGKVLERDEIYRRVWGYSMVHGDRSVDVFVRKLRSKLQKRSPGWDYIHTHFGIGYRFDPQPLQAGADSTPGERQVAHQAPGASEVETLKAAIP
jgi:DNA-binding response OmpR family regulator